MPQSIDPAKTAVDIQILILDEFGKRIYGDKNPHNVARRFKLTQVKVLDIINACRPNAAPKERLEHLLDLSSTEIHTVLQKSELKKFIKTAHLGRCALEKRAHDPNLFVHFDVYYFAKKLLAQLARDRELA